MREPSVGVYVHVPFCERVCPYCDFAVVGTRSLAADVERRYVDALLAELQARRPDFAGRRLASLYLGGGTPSLLTPDSVDRIARGVRRAFAPSAETETTLEVNPGTVDRERLPGFRAAGMRRVSVGVQSFDDTTLRRLGRAHRGEEARRTLQACRDAGFETLSLDLLFAAPGQRLPGVEADLAAAVAFAPEHVSAYELTIEPATPFARARPGQLDRAGEDEVVAMMAAVEARLGAAGLARYEISSYARPGREAVHNRRYWERQPVLGLGMGAVSNDPPGKDAPFGVRRANPRALPVYLAAVETGDAARVGTAERLGPATARGEAVFLALRTVRGLDAAGFAAEFGGPPRHFFRDAIEALAGAGLLEEAASGDLRLSARGRLLSDHVFERFV